MHEISSIAATEGLISFDVEHLKSLNPNYPGFRLSGCAFATADRQWYIKDMDEIAVILNELLPLEDIEWIAHNAKYDVKCLKALGFAEPKKLRCTMIAANLLHDNFYPNELGLKPLSSMFLGVRPLEFSEVGDDQDSPEFSQYAQDDARNCYDLYVKIFRGKLESQGMKKLFEELLCPASTVFGDVEKFGIRWDRAEGRRQGRMLTRVLESAQHSIRRLAGDLNPGSPKQLQKFLFGTLGIPTDGLGRTPKGDVSTDEKTMTALAGRHPFCADILRYRTASKQLSTYVEKFNQLSELDPDSRIHANFYITSSTGRSRSSDPNLQNITARFHRAIADDFKNIQVRKAFVPSEGMVFLDLDFSQIELRIIAHISQDEEMVRAFINGEDLHQITTDKVSALYGDRSKGKEVNFSVVYDCSARTLHERHPDLSIKGWEKVRQEFFELHPAIVDWHTRVEGQILKRGYVRDLFGRLRRFSPQDIRNNFHSVRRQGINFVPQASASILTFLSALKMRRLWEDRGWWLKGTDLIKSRVKIVNLIHDEILIECDPGIVDQVAVEAKDIMQNAIKLSVPVLAGSKIAYSWADCKG